MNFWQQVAADIQGAWGELTVEVESDALVAWNAIKTIWLTLAPEQWTILKGLVATADADVANGDYGDLVTDVLNQAEAQELAWVKELGSEVLTAIIAVLKQTPKT